MQIPPSVLAQYQSVNALANQTASTPFAQYGGEFVAPVNAQQTQGINATNTAATQAQPGYAAANDTLNTAQGNTAGVNNAALGLAGASAGAVNPTDLDSASINKYLSPYLSSVLGSTAGLLNQNNQQAMSGQLGTAIQSGAFGGDRTGVAAANLNQQQNLANANIYSNIANQGYQSALGTAQQQQGVGLAAGQANRTALANAGQEIAGIGQTAYGEGANTAAEQGSLASGAQTAGLQGANAQIAAGTVQQQTQQAKDTAEYNQFLQQQSYPFQVDQFLANIAEGTGALSGSTTTTQQPGGFFSDKRLKHDIKKIGETFDHQDIYSYKMHGDNRTHIGLIAQKVEKKHPSAVGVDPGTNYKMVDYGRATEDAANRGHFYSGGVVPLRRAYASGGPSIVSPGDLSAILEAQQQMYAPMAGSAGVYGGAGGSVPRGGSSRVPAPTGAIPHLVTADGGLKRQPTGAQNMSGVLGLVRQGQDIYDDNRKPVRHTVTNTTDGGLAHDSSAPNGVMPDTTEASVSPDDYARGGVAGRRGYDDGGSVDDLSAVLQAQQNMYRPMQHGRDIPNQSHGTPQLAVASGSPTPAPSGSNNLSQGLGLAQKGYKTYKHFNPPTTSGVNPTLGDTAGIQNSATAASAPAADSSTVSGIAPTAGAGLDTAGAAEAAAPVAADAAGSAAAGAGAGAAAGAGAEVAGAAAVDSAAALAAEYAAAEAAAAVAAAAVAAKRGGRINRKGFDAGGMPYEGDGAGTPYGDAGGQIDIPDTENTAHLQTAGPIKKQPTGLQTAMTLGDPNKVGGIMGSMFSNEALARGGVAARRGYDDGGDVEDVPEGPPTDVVPRKVEGVKPADLKMDSGHSWWDRNKGKAIPLLTGLAAMGTAPTRSFGTALAAGLGAGARAYVPTQEGLADTRQTEATTRGVDIQNQIAAMKAKAASDWINGAPPAEAPAKRIDPTKTAQNIDQQYRSKYYVVPWTPDEQAKMHKALGASVTMGNAPVEDAQKTRDQRVLNQTSQNQNNAQAEADNLYDAAAAGDTAAMVKYNALHQWTGDKYEGSEGARINSRTGAPAIGIAAQTLTPEQRSNREIRLAEPVTYGAGLPTPIGKAAGISTNPTGAGVRPAPAVIQPQKRQPVVTAPAIAPSVNADPVLTKAMADPKYDLAPIQTPIDQVSLQAAKDQQKAISEKKQQLQEDAEATAQSSGAALQFAKAARQIMESKGAPVTGIFGPAMKAVSSVFGTVDATNYQEVAKYLGNLAVQTGKANFSNTTDKNTSLQFEQLNPSTANTEGALKDLLDSNIRTNQYTLDTANRTTNYLDPKKNKDPQKFFRWNQEHYPRADVVNPSEALETGKSKSGRDIVRVNGRWEYKP